MKKQLNNPPHYKSGNAENNDFMDYKSYPAGEDIYNNYKEEEEVDPEDISKIKPKYPADKNGADIDALFKNFLSEGELDIPGSELDDQQEIDGNEDEENNYYSLGGDGHNDLDEDNDDM